MDPVRIIGDVVSRNADEHPERSRRWLETAYGAVALKGRLRVGSDVPALVDRHNGAIASTIVSALKHPERACMVNIYQPCEMLHALGITPMFPEGISVYVACTQCAEVFCDHAEQCGVPESFCSYHKLMLGMADTQVLPVPPVVAHTTLACDANQVSFRRLAERGGAQRLVLDVPARTDEETVAYVAGQLREQARALAVTYHRELDPQRLRDVCATSLRTLRTQSALLKRRARASLPMDLTAELCSMITTHCLLGTPEGLTFAQGLLEAATHSPRPAVNHRPRIYWHHTLPNWQASMTRVFSEQAEVVGNEMANDSVGVIGELDPDDPFDFMARRLVKCTGNGPALRRAEASAEQAVTSGADGGVLFAHWGCKQTSGQSRLVAEAYAKRGLPLLVLDGDGCDPRNASDGQMVTRAQAFLERLA